MLHLISVSEFPLDDALTALLSGFIIEQQPTLPDTAPEILFIDAELISLEALARYRQQHPRVILIVFSTSDDIETRVRYFTAGADAFFARPTSAAVVFAHVSSLRRRKMMKQS